MARWGHATGPRRWTLLDQADAGGMRYGRRLRRDVELQTDVGKMAMGGVRADEKLVGTSRSLRPRATRRSTSGSRRVSAALRFFSISRRAVRAS